MNGTWRAFMTSVFDNKENLSEEEVVRRFRKVVGRDMTPEERVNLSLRPETLAKPNPEKKD
jgi:hypothetical protein